MSLYKRIFSWLSRQSPEMKKPIEALSAELIEKRHLADSVWQHKKGGMYRIICIAFREQTMELEVVYRDAEHPVTYIRPYHEFMDGRFTQLKPNT